MQVKYDDRKTELEKFGVSVTDKMDKINTCFQDLDRKLNELILWSTESNDQSGLHQLPVFADTKDELSLLFTASVNTMREVVDNEKKICDEKKKELKRKEFEYMKLTKKLIDEFQSKMNNELLDVDAVKAKEIENEKKLNLSRAEKAEKIKKVFATAQRSQLFCDFYKPDGDKIYERFGFDWPKEQDLIDLCVNHNIEPKDLVLEKVNWIKDACGFSMLQFEFKGGIASPQFRCTKADGASYITTELEPDQTAKHIRLQIAENKFVEQLEFLNRKDGVYAAQPGEVNPARRHPVEHSVMFAKCCRGNDDSQQEYIDIPEGHSIIGMFGFTKTNKYVNTELWPTGIRDWDTIRGIGFVTMKLDA